MKRLVRCRTQFATASLTFIVLKSSRRAAVLACTDMTSVLTRTGGTTALAPTALAPTALASTALTPVLALAGMRLWQTAVIVRLHYVTLISRGLMPVSCVSSSLLMLVRPSSHLWGHRLTVGEAIHSSIR